MAVELGFLSEWGTLSGGGLVGPDGRLYLIVVSRLANGSGHFTTDPGLTSSAASAATLGGIPVSDPSLAHRALRQANVPRNVARALVQSVADDAIRLGNATFRNILWGGPVA